VLHFFHFPILRAVIAGEQRCRRTGAPFFYTIVHDFVFDAAFRETMSQRGLPIVVINYYSKYESNTVRNVYRK
jgi:hypothetical protein